MTAETSSGFEIRLFELISRLDWLVKIRWIAVAGVIAAIFSAVEVFSLALPRVELYTAAAFLAAGNSAFSISINCFGSGDNSCDLEASFRRAVALADVQVVFDLAMLTLLLHYAGGYENPFKFYYIFHIVIASMLMLRLRCYLYAAMACVMYCGMVVAERFGAIRHYSQSSVFRPAFTPPAIEIAGDIIAFVTAISATAYMATSIAGRLREKEAALAAANRKLVDMDARKSEFVITAAHELKSPIGTMQFMVKSILDGYNGAIDQKVRETLVRVEAKASSMLKLVTDLLDLSKINTGLGAREFKKISLVEKLDKAIEMVMPRARAASVSITKSAEGCDDGLVIDGDPEYLENVIVNIVLNAVKYSAAGGTVRLSLARLGGQAIFTCQDEGIGIAGSDLEKIFEGFYRAPSAKKHSPEGSGVGLSIARKIAEYHGGSITVESQPGKGSKFTLILPAAGRSPHEEDKRAVRFVN